MTVSNSRPFAAWIVITSTRAAPANLALANSRNELLLEARHVVEIRDRLDLLQPCEIRLRVVEVLHARQRRRPAERIPGAFDPDAQRPAAAFGQRCAEDLPGPRETHTPVVGQPTFGEQIVMRRAERARDRCFDRRVRLPCQRMQVRESQATPRRAQHRQPRCPIRDMHQRARQRDQVLHDRPVAQLFDLDRLKVDARCRELACDRIHVRARRDENCDASVGGSVPASRARW